MLQFFGKKAGASDFAKASSDKEVSADKPAREA